MKKSGTSRKAVSRFPRWFGLILCACIWTLQVPAQELNQTDAQGRKQGKWIKKYKNGNIRYRGQFKDDKPTGLFVYYDYKLNKTAEVTFQEDGTAATRLFHAGGNVVAGEGAYDRSQQRTGLWSFYDSRGVLSAREMYERDQRHGESRTYYVNGKVARKTEYVRGEETGTRIDYYEDGTVRFEGRVIDGVFDGVVTFYHPNEKISQQGTYRDGVRDGEWKVYDERGQVLRTDVYEQGILRE